MKSSTKNTTASRTSIQVITGGGSGKLVLGKTIAAEKKKTLFLSLLRHLMRKQKTGESSSLSCIGRSRREKETTGRRWRHEARLVKLT